MSRICFATHLDSDDMSMRPHGVLIWHCRREDRRFDTNGRGIVQTWNIEFSDPPDLVNWYTIENGQKIVVEGDELQVWEACDDLNEPAIFYRLVVNLKQD